MKTKSQRLLPSIILPLIILTVSSERSIAAMNSMTLTVDGTERKALVYVPVKHDSKMPLVFVFHGHGGTSRNIQREIPVDTLWPEAISVYPQGLNTPGQLLDPQGERAGWQKGEGAEGDRDLHFVDALLSKLKHDNPIDERQIYCTGHSNGGSFTYLLWKTRPDIFAAFAPCSAAAGYATQLKPKPALISGGRNDPLVKFAWQEGTMRAVERNNHCDSDGQAFDTDATLYPSSVGAPVVTLIYNGGHPMKDGEGDMIVKFFKQIAAGNLQGATTRP